MTLVALSSWPLSTKQCIVGHGMNEPPLSISKNSGLGWSRLRSGDEPVGPSRPSFALRVTRWDEGQTELATLLIACPAPTVAVSHGLGDRAPCWEWEERRSAAASCSSLHILNLDRAVTMLCSQAACHCPMPAFQDVDLLNNAVTWGVSD
jgi:hypothetical protein